MKASELRIGNFVERITNNKEHVCIEKVESIKGLPFYGDLPSSYCVPIPLTEKWLLKFGFEKRYYEITNTNHFYFGKLQLFQDANTGEIYWDMFITETVVKLKHVHQLQNLYFAMTGEELTINPSNCLSTV